MLLPQAKGTRKRVAVIDDSEAVRRSLLLLLVSRGFDVDAYTGRTDFLAGLGHVHYDCFVIDLKLDDAGGVELLAEIRLLGRSQPAVLISGWEIEGLECLASQSGFAALVRKPMMETSIIDEIGRILAA